MLGWAWFALALPGTWARALWQDLPGVLAMFAVVYGTLRLARVEPRLRVPVAASISATLLCAGLFLPHRGAGSIDGSLWLWCASVVLAILRLRRETDRPVYWVILAVGLAGIAVRAMLMPVYSSSI